MYNARQTTETSSKRVVTNGNRRFVGELRIGSAAAQPRTWVLLTQHASAKTNPMSKPQIANHKLEMV